MYWRFAFPCTYKRPSLLKKTANHTMANPKTYKPLCHTVVAISLLLLALLLSVDASNVHSPKGRKERAHRYYSPDLFPLSNIVRFCRLRAEALNVSGFADSLLVPFRSSVGIVKNGTTTIYDLVEHLQRFGDRRRIKKYYIRDFDAWMWVVNNWRAVWQKRFKM